MLIDPTLGELNAAITGPPGTARDQARDLADKLFGASERLIVYGSLAPGRVHHHEVASLGGTWTRGWVTGDLLETGWGSELGYPALRYRAGGPQVAAWLLTSAALPPAWERLDRFEGAAYQRVLAPFETDRGVAAVGYIYAATGWPPPLPPGC
jgi:gamma-glutamylcyclotransferase (GGCT)/AIG2-like uncharacterized protein YtfP